MILEDRRLCVVWKTALACMYAKKPLLSWPKAYKAPVIGIYELHEI
jgi:hypothetical protein